MRSKLELLSGVKVVGFTQWLFGPAAALYLADMGAEVIKVEPPETGSWERGWAGGNTFLNGMSASFLMTHRNVRSLALNLKREEGHTAATDLIATADVVISNYRPGVMERLGLDYERLRAANPALIYAVASGYGDSGPYAALPGQDLLLQAMTGMIWASGQHGQSPRPAGAAVVDQHAGLLLAAGVLAALVQRARTGEGQRVDVNMIQAAMDLQLEPWVYHLNDGTVTQPRTGLGSTFHQAPYGVYRVEDGFLVLSLNSMAALGEALGAPDLADFDDAETIMVVRDEIYESVARLLHARNRDETVAYLRGYGIWCAPVLSYDEAIDDPGIRHVDPIMTIDHPIAGTVRVLKHPINYSSGAATVRRPPPSVGEHSAEVLREVGYSNAQIKAALGVETIDDAG